MKQWEHIYHARLIFWGNELFVKYIMQKRTLCPDLKFFRTFRCVINSELNLITMKKSYLWLVVLSVLVGLQACNLNSGNTFQSPDGKCKAVLKTSDEALLLSLFFDGDTLLDKTEFVLSTDSFNLSKAVKITRIQETKTDETWEAVNGKNPIVRNYYNGYLLDCQNELGKIFNLEFRLYDKGFAYRFLFPEPRKVVKENSTIRFPFDFSLWAYNGENHNIGPVKISNLKDEKVRNPVVLETRRGNYFAIHEAAIFDYAPFVLTNNSKSLAFNLVQSCIPADSSVKSSWRAFMIGREPGDLIESDLLVNLNEPCKIDDTSWIRPGRTMWDWRVWGYTAPDGFQYGLNTVSHKRFIDFAAKNNVQYLLIDADWYGPEFSENADPTSAREGVNIEECMAYAKEKGVGIILYLNDVGARKFGLERVLKQFADWGAAGVKYGFMTGTPQEKVVNTRRIVELCAENKLMVDFHDNPIAPSGDRRTWPNLITKEFGHAQADAKRSYFPETAVTAPFVNMLAGPLDLSDGWFSLNDAFGHGRQRVFEPIPGTVTAEVAKLMVIYSGLLVLPDAPEEYLKKDDLFDCIRQMPAEFDGYKVIKGEIGRYISVARKAGDEWFVGTLTNRDMRKLQLNFEFLDSGKQYVATFYEDAPDAHYLNNKEAYQIRKDIPIYKETKIVANLAPGGGQAFWIRPVSK